MSLVLCKSTEHIVLPNFWFRVKKKCLMIVIVVVQLLIL